MLPQDRARQDESRNIGGHATTNIPVQRPTLDTVAVHSGRLPDRLPRPSIKNMDEDTGLVRRSAKIIGHRIGNSATCSPALRQPQPLANAHWGAEGLGY